jgi:raffinose/stachyose/melibiose transport system substrate-binding protein
MEMRLTKRWVALLAALFLVAAACGDGAEETTTSAAGGAGETTTSTAGPAVEPQTLTLWHNQADPDAVVALYERFEQDTGHTLEIVLIPQDGFETATLQKWATGERPDILSYHGSFEKFLALNPEENLRDLSNEDFVARAVPGLLDTNGNVNGKVYALILRPPTPWGFYTNKQLVAELGITLPTNAAEIITYCQDLRASNPELTPIAEGGGSGWPPLVAIGVFVGDQLLNGGWLDALQDRTVKLDDADSPWLGSLNHYADMIEAGCFADTYLSDTYEDAYAALVEGDAPMLSQLSSVLLDIGDAFGADALENIGFQAWSATQPVVTVETSPHGTYYLPITGDAAKEAAALEFVRWASSPEVYADFLAAVGEPSNFVDVPNPSGLPNPVVEGQAAILEFGSMNVIWNFLPGADVGCAMGVAAATESPEGCATEFQSTAEQGAGIAGLPGWEN